MNFQSFITIIVIIAVIGAAVVWYFYLRPSDEGLVAVTPEGNVAVSSDLKIALVLSKLRNIQLDTAVFSNAVYKSLVDAGIEITPPLDRGRPNPFAPIGQFLQSAVSGPPAPFSAPP